MILNIKQISIFIPTIFIPEYMTYIIIKSQDESFLQDYETNKSYNLSNKEALDFDKDSHYNWKYFAITFINKNLSREILSISN